MFKDGDILLGKIDSITKGHKVMFVKNIDPIPELPNIPRIRVKFIESSGDTQAKNGFVCDVYRDYYYTEESEDCLLPDYLKAENYYRKTSIEREKNYLSALSKVMR